MKILLLILCAFTATGVHAAVNGRSLSPPPSPFSKSSVPFKETQEKLDHLLKSGELADFYQELFGLALESGKTGWNEGAAEDQYGSLLYCFYAAKAPLISFSYEKMDGIPRVNNGISFDQADITIKRKSSSRLLTISYRHSNHLFKKREELGRLSSEYFAEMLQCVRDLHDPKLEENLKATMEKIRKDRWEQFRKKWAPWEKQSEERRRLWREKKFDILSLSDEEKKKILEQHESWERELSLTNNDLQAISCRMGILERRNRDIPHIVKGMEKDFVEILVNYFPGKKGEVVKYIRMAGYRNDEINSLIDRTVGRDGKTEFLYKGRSKKDAR